MRKKAALMLALVCLVPLLALAQGAPPSLRQKNDADLEKGVYDAFFDDALFVGDSVTNQLYRYILSQRYENNVILSKVRFLVADSYSLANAARNKPDGKVTMKYRGEDITIPQAVKKIGHKTVFVMLGLNDHVGSNMATDVRRYRDMMNHILEENPDATLVCQSMTPIQKQVQTNSLKQRYLNAFNEKIQGLCKELGAVYLDIATPLMGEDGYIRPEYALSKTDDLHLSKKGLRVWIDTLRRFARDRYEQGLWSPSGR